MKHDVAADAGEARSGDSASDDRNPGAVADRLVLDPVLASLIAIAVVGIVVSLVKLGASILNPILLGVYIAALAYPLFRRLEARPSRRPLALLATAGVIALGALGFVLLLSASTLSSGLVSYAPRLSQRAEEVLGGLPLV